MKTSALTLLLTCTLATPTAIAQVKLPAHTRQTLPNGIQVVMAPRREIPMITLRALVRGGSDADPGELYGLTAATAELLRRGTAEFDADRFAEKLDALGAELTVTANREAIAIGLDFLAKDQPAAIGLLASAMLRPAFDEKQVAKTLAERVSEAKASKDEAQDLVRLFFRPFYFGPKHPYGHPDTGDEVSLSAIQRGDIVKQYQKLFRGRNTILTAVGDFEPPQLLARLRESFQAMPAGDRYPWPSAAEPAPAKSARLLLIDKPDATQTYFLIGQPGIHRLHPDRTVLWLVNTLFGGRFTSMLNDELRVNSGLSYGAGSRVQLDRLQGSISISSFTKTETTVQAIDLALEVLGRLRTRGIDAEQLKSVKAYVKGTYPTEALETNDQIAGLLGDLELHGLGRGEIDDLFSRIDSVTLEQANAAAKKYYRESNLQFCLAGNAAKVRDAVKKYAPERMQEIKASAPGVRIPAKQ